MSSAGTAPPRAPSSVARGGRATEPVLAIQDIQGNVVPGFATTYQCFIFVEILDPARGREWLQGLPVTSLAAVLGVTPTETGDDVPVWVNVALTYSGLTKVRADAACLTDMPFKAGMPERSVLLGDPASHDAAGNAQNWVVGRPGQGLDAVLIVASDDPARLDAAVAEFRRRLPSGVEVRFEQAGQARQPPLARHEPFGFRDDISQPGVRGRLSEAPEDFLTPGRNPADADQGAPGQNLVWPGEFIFGYPGQSTLDRRRPGPVVGGGPSWTANGSLLVLRRLRQDVAGFHRFLDDAAEDLSRRYEALAELTPEQLGAKLMGRWASGAPMALTPEVDRPWVGADPEANNDFSFAAPSAQGTPSGSTTGGGDPYGLACPRAAHIRRAYPRGAPTPGLTEATIETHRLLRRSIAFDTRVDQGIVFLAYQSSIERQFEFVTRAWLNNPHLHDTDDGHDPIAGQSFGVGGDRSRIFTIPVAGAGDRIERIPLTLPADWVVPTGGGYFFSPSLTMLGTLR